MNTTLMETLLKFGKPIFQLTTEGDYPGGSSTISLLQHNNLCYGLSDYGEYFGPVNNWEEIMEWEVFDYVHQHFEIHSDILSKAEIQNIQLQIEKRSSATHF